MLEVTSKLTPNLGIDVINGNGSNSWPMCMISVFLVRQSTSALDCSPLESLLEFIIWSQLNIHVYNKIQELGYTPLPLGYKAYIVISILLEYLAKISFRPFLVGRQYNLSRHSHVMV